MARQRTSRRRYRPAKPEHGQVIRLAEDHPAVVEGRTLHQRLLRSPNEDDWVLKSGEHNRKLGSHVTKRKWQGFPIFSLSLEERATCPRSCAVWNICYGNHVSQYKAYRYRHGPELEAQLARELKILSVEAATRRGFVVRLHALGDFYSVEYVSLWREWLQKYTPLRVFGYTAWPRSSEIGQTVGELADEQWDRFAIRFSEASDKQRSAGTIIAETSRPDPSHVIVCPVETGKTDCCGTCGLCWTTDKRIVFVEH